MTIIKSDLHILPLTHQMADAKSLRSDSDFDNDAQTSTQVSL